MANTVYQPSTDVQITEKHTIDSSQRAPLIKGKRTHGVLIDQASTPSHYAYEPDLQFKLTSLLQTTLEIEPLLDLFFGQLQHLLKLNSCHFSLKDNNIDIILGQASTHTTDYTLNLQSQYLGNIVLSRKQRFTESELAQIESLLGVLIYPLRNALRYKEALHQAMSDPLTNLGNRGALEQAFAHQLQMAERYEQHFSLLMIDLDHFKKINDTYGHAVGDNVLKAVAKSIQATTRQTDVAYRYGGEEFVVILNKSQVLGANIIAERIRENISHLIIPAENGKTINVTTSIGGSSTYENQSPQELMKQADKALYRAKESGRDCVEFFHNDNGSHIHRNLSVSH